MKKADNIVEEYNKLQSVENIGALIHAIENFKYYKEEPFSIQSDNFDIIDFYFSEEGEFLYCENEHGTRIDLEDFKFNELVSIYELLKYYNL